MTEPDAIPNRVGARLARLGPGGAVALSVVLHLLLLLGIARLTALVDLRTAATAPAASDLPIPPEIHARLSSLTFDPNPTDAEAAAPRTIPPPIAVPDILPDPELDRMLDSIRESASASAPDGLTDLDAFLTDPIDLINDSSFDARTDAAFGGVRTSNARRIAFVIDGSGSMMPYLQNILDELDRALRSLTEEQFFAVLFFQGNESVMAPPVDRLTLATDRNVAAAMQWVAAAQILPRGRSSPLAAMRQAIALKPDVIFLMSENITGAGEFEIEHTQLLTYLDELNPVIPGSDGRRRVRINCIQFLEPRGAATLRAIAEQHGGLDGYAELTRDALGLGR